MTQTVDIKVPALGESVSQATVARWTKKVGDTIQADETLVELETEKVTLDVTAPISGVIAEILETDGATVTIGSLLGRIQEGAVAKESVKKPTSADEAAAVGDIKLSPAVSKLVADQKLDPKAIPASGKDGRLTKGDVVNFLDTKSAPSQPSVSVTQGKDGLEERVRMTRLRQKIAERLKQAQNTAAILTTFNEVDMTNIFALRGQYKDAFEKKHGIKLGFMSFFVKACVQALKELPMINAEIDGDDIVYKNYYDIGVAVSAPQGLVVPVVRNADQLSFADVEKTIAGLGAKARDNKLAMEDLMGGTFTISNGGTFGSLMSTPIINPPQSAILGMHKVQERPMVVDGQIVVRPMMYLALSYDHRLIDGREAVTFLVRVKEYVERPDRLLLEV